MELTLKDFIQQVKAMRNAQKSYFNTRYPEALRNAKKLEKQVDTTIKNYEEQISNSNKIKFKSLF